MGAINLDNTGSGGAITLSSDGTSLLLGGTAVGGGGADLYAANESSPAAQPSATGTNAIAIGDTAVSSGTDSFAIGKNTDATGTGSLAVGQGAQATANYNLAIGLNANASAERAIAIGNNGVVAGSTYSTAIGHNSGFGGSTTATGSGATALGGSYASGADSFAAVITNNTSSYGATGANSIAIGKLAKATNTDSFAVGDNAIASGGDAIAIGRLNTASSAYSVAIGYDNDATGNYSIAMGYRANAGAHYAVAIGQASNLTRSNAFGQGSMALAGGRTDGVDAISIGREGRSNEIGKFVFSNGMFAAAGDAQGGMFILKADTTNATATVLTTNNSTAHSNNQIKANSDTCITFDGTITAMQNGAQAFASFKIEGLLVNDGGTTTLANSAITIIDNQSSWGLALSADNTNNALAITVTGEASHNIRWVANIRTSEVTYA